MDHNSSNSECDDKEQDEAEIFLYTELYFGNSFDKQDDNESTEDKAKDGDPPGQLSNTITTNDKIQETVKNNNESKINAINMDCAKSINSVSIESNAVNQDVLLSTAKDSTPTNIETKCKETKPVFVGDYCCDISDSELFQIDTTSLSIHPLADKPPNTQGLKRKAEQIELNDNEEESRCLSMTKKKLHSLKVNEKHEKSPTVLLVSSEEEEGDNDELRVLPFPVPKTYELVTVESESSEGEEKNRKTNNQKASNASSQEHYISVLYSDDSSCVSINSVDLTMSVSQGIDELINPSHTVNNFRISKDCNSYKKSQAIYTVGKALTKRIPSVPTYSNEMAAFYDSDASEDLDLYKTLSSMSSSDEYWKVCNNEYLKRSRRRYFENKQRCKRCRQYDHQTRDCPRVPRCMMCSEQSHTKRFQCPNNLCFKCSGQPHIICKKVTFSCVCSLCGARGHLEKMCPDIWRRFHITTSGDGMVPVVPKRPKVKPLRNAYCFNCAKRGHYGHKCTKRYLNKDYWSASPFICNYEIPLPMTGQFNSPFTSPIDNTIQKEVTEDNVKQNNSIESQNWNDKDALSTHTFSVSKSVNLAIFELEEFISNTEANINVDQFNNLINHLMKYRNTIKKGNLSKSFVKKFSKQLHKLSFIVYGQLKLGKGREFMQKIDSYLVKLKETKIPLVPKPLLTAINQTVRMVRFTNIKNYGRILALAVNHKKQYFSLPVQNKSQSNFRKKKKKKKKGDTQCF